METKSEEKIIISFVKHRNIINKFVLIDHSLYHSGSFYEQIGLKRIDKMKNDGVHLQIVNKSKLIHAMIKYNFTL